MTDYIAIVLDSHGLHSERDPHAFRVTRPYVRWGVLVGLVWAKWRWPQNFRKANPWFDPKPDIVIRQTGTLFGWTIPLPWFSIWYWRRATWDRERGTASPNTHPARFYLGHKMFYVGPDGENDLAGHAWARPDERGQFYACLTASFRRGGEGK